MDDLDTSFFDDFSFDFDSPESARISRGSSYEFHPYFIMNVHNEVRSKNIKVRHDRVTTTPQQYNSDTHIVTQHDSHTRLSVLSNCPNLMNQTNINLKYQK